MAALSEGDGDRLRSADGRAFFPLRRSGRGPSRVFVGIDRHSPEAPPALGNRRAIPSVCHFACTSFLVAAVSAHWGIHGSFGEGGRFVSHPKAKKPKSPPPSNEHFWGYEVGRKQRRNDENECTRETRKQDAGWPAIEPMARSLASSPIRSPQRARNSPNSHCSQQFNSQLVIGDDHGTL